MGQPLLVRDVETLREKLGAARERGLRVGLVPTMGALHDGHLALVREARRRAQLVVLTIFVNPTQFGPNEDFTRYPRTLEADLARSAEAGVDVVFAPSDPSVLYPADEETRVRVGATAQHLEGAFRPGHFEGVATICAKLFAVTGPCVAAFGRKDYQQLRVVTRLVKDLFLPVEIVPCTTQREADGLARSSRNAYLSPADRERARALPTGLAAAVRAFEAGERRADALLALAKAPIEAVAASFDYVALADADSVAPYPPGALLGERALLAAAVRVGATRLIDNVVLGEDRGPAALVA